ncbi:hypothetical protein [Microbulbifer hydrolyticus]|uniref:DUF1871 family protein n=1 Tax=Microbulbifer hydrolyticus TaxID=48074 RepID=A0A6P1T9A1_9GAMM|nr:hypothetical protein [Microbulbifer hydrolyticus]MBB5213310.1 hypothetical protein [Microbulbifer hydrolyticus]QHQ38607.1 hypothetical protein GTQ55_06135 [Microbulbifer hydrolyticus]
MKYSENRKSHNSLKVISKILNEWDPLGVSKYVADEYDMYIGGLIYELDRGCNVKEMSEILDGIVRGRMGVRPNSDSNYIAASKLLEHWRKFEIASE